LSCPTAAQITSSGLPSATRANLGRRAAEEASKPVKRRPKMEEAKTSLRSRRCSYSRMLDELLTKERRRRQDFPSEARKIFLPRVPGARASAASDRRRAC